jgi:hypothetical protein
LTTAATGTAPMGGHDDRGGHDRRHKDLGAVEEDAGIGAAHGKSGDGELGENNGHGDVVAGWSGAGVDALARGEGRSPNCPAIEEACGEGWGATAESKGSRRPTRHWIPLNRRIEAAIRGVRYA